jgi:hypothetical protein
MQDRTKEIAMRNVVVSEFVSLDGVMEELARYGWQYPHDYGPERIPER